MDRKKLLHTLASLVIFIFLANFLANKFYWYSSIWYFDILMHFLGGFWVGILGLYFFGTEPISLRIIFKIVLLVVIVGIGWEIFEACTDTALSKNPFNALDSVSDVLLDIAGGTVALLHYIKRIMNGAPHKVQ